MLFIIFVILPVVNYELLQETNCIVTRVDYPTTLPTVDYEVETAHINDQDWVECDCGRRCMSWTPCIRIYQNDTLIREEVATFSHVSGTNFSGGSNANAKQYLIFRNETPKVLFFMEYMHTSF
jgi:hypothetical protein